MVDGSVVVNGREFHQPRTSPLLDSDYQTSTRNTKRKCVYRGPENECQGLASQTGST